MGHVLRQANFRGLRVLSEAIAKSQGEGAETQSETLHLAMCSLSQLVSSPPAQICQTLAFLQSYSTSSHKVNSRLLSVL